MKKIYFSGICLLLLASAATFLLSQPREEDHKLSKRDRIDLAMAQEREMTKDPNTGEVPRERLLLAKAYKDAMPQPETAIGGVNWVSLGSKNQGGRTRALLIDANDATGKTIFAGSVGGGLWKTTDISAAAPNWSPVNDFMGNLAITSIAQHPTTPNTMYLSTGEPYFNSDAIRGMGVWKSTNGGTTWTQLASTSGANYQYCYKIFVAANGYVFVGTRSGLFRSIDNGTSFTKVLGSGTVAGATSNRAYDVEQATNGDIYASLAGSIHKSTNNGGTFGAGMTLPFTANRIEIACAPSSASTVYVLCEANSTVSGIAQTTNGGTSWTAKTEPADADPGISNTDFSRTQAWYDLAIAVDPNNANTLMVGAIDLFKSTDGAGTWTQISHWYGGFGFQNVHADNHNIFYRNGSSTEAYFVNDGGVYRSTNANTTTPTITDKGTNYVTTQFFGCAMHPTATLFLAGAQDNGSHKFNSLVLANTVEVTGGDGAFCNIDQDQPQYQFTQYVRNNYRRSTNGGTSFSTMTGGSNVGNFINPSDYDNVNNKIYAPYNSTSYYRIDNTTGAYTTTTVPAAFGATASAVKVSPSIINQVWFGAGGDVFQVSNAHTAAPTVNNRSTGLPNGSISCIEVQSGNENHILVCYSNYGVNSVWETYNGGASWTSVEGNLPDMPIRWIMFHPTDNDKAFVATELGVWSTDDLNGTNTNWGSTNSGLANVRVDMIESRPSDFAMIASTHGRGLFYSDAFLILPQAAFNANKTVAYQGESIQFTSTSTNATSYAWNFGDGNTSTLQNPSHTYATGGQFTVSLSINGAVSTETKTNYIHMIPNLAVPYTAAMGGDFESNPLHFITTNITGTPWEKGSSAVVGKSGTRSGTNAYVTSLVGNYVINSESYLYTPSFIMSNPGTYTLQFYRKGQLEANYDGFIVESSIDFGNTWLPVGTTVATNWYDFANPNNTSFPSGQAYFNQDKTTFTLSQRDVSSLAGNAAVAFRVAFKTDGSVVDNGYAIDDFSLVGPPNAPLTVGFIDLNAESKGKSNLVKWITKDEENVKSFSIERSVDGTNFVTVGNAEAKNKLDNKYTFTDLLSSVEQTRVLHYYRIKITDNDGKLTFSNIANVMRNSRNSDVVIFPNPCTDHINVYSQEKIKNVQLYSLTGSLIAWDMQMVNGKLDLPTSMAPGVYFIKVAAGNSYSIQKITKK